MDSLTVYLMLLAGSVLIASLAVCVCFAICSQVCADNSNEDETFVEMEPLERHGSTNAPGPGPSTPPNAPHATPLTPTPPPFPRSMTVSLSDAEAKGDKSPIQYPRLFFPTKQ